MLTEITDNLKDLLNVGNCASGCKEEITSDLVVRILRVSTKDEKHLDGNGSCFVKAHIFYFWITINRSESDY